MNKEQRLESVVNHYRQLLADEQLKVASLSVEIKDMQETIQRLQEELDNVQKEDAEGKKSASKDAK